MRRPPVCATICCTCYNYNTSKFLYYTAALRTRARMHRYVTAFNYLCADDIDDGYADVTDCHDDDDVDDKFMLLAFVLP